MFPATIPKKERLTGVPSKIEISTSCLVCSSVKTDLMEEGANSTLSIARVGPGDSGNYTCHLTTMPDQPATIHVHVLNGENEHFSVDSRRGYESRDPVEIRDTMSS